MENETQAGRKTIAIVGANGQVGSEVALYLSLMPGVRVVAVSRSVLGSTILRRCGLECRHGSVDDESQCRELLRECDLVADFSLPRGSVADIRRASRALVTNAIRHAPPGAAYVYISSLMALGMRDRSQSLRFHLFPYTVYAAWKRYSERLARKCGARIRRPIFVLRLGDVHGQLQSISANLLDGARDGFASVPDGYSYTVFAYSIAEALANIALGREQPGTYTLVSEPGYSWKEILEIYFQRAGIEPHILVEKRGHEYLLLQRLGDGVRSLTRSLLSFAVRNREFLVANVLRFAPSLELPLKAAYARRQARLEVAAEGKVGYRPFTAWRGTMIPGARLRSLSDPRTSMGPFEAKLGSLLRERL